MQIRETSGGIVVNGNRICLVYQPGKTWCIPKGGVEENETKEQAARREIREETGLRDLEIVSDLGTFQRLSFDDNQLMLNLHVYLFKTDQEILEPEESDHHAEWFYFEEAITKLTSDVEREFVKANLEKVIE